MVATAPRRWKIDGYTQLNDPPSDDGGYVKSLRQGSHSKVATAARRWKKDV
jgi:hypothetical protein